MPKIAEFAQLPDGRMAVVLDTPTTDEGSVTIWTEAEKDRHAHLTRVDEREACAQVAESYLFGPTAARTKDVELSDSCARAIAGAIRLRSDN